MDALEGHIPGSVSRSCVVGALHFDFQFAQSQANYSEAQQKYKEDATNLQVINNVLKNLKEVFTRQGGKISDNSMASQSDSQIREKLLQFLSLTKGLQAQMRSPYF